MYCSINKFKKKNSIPLSLDCEKHHTSNSRSYFWISKIFTDFIYAMQKKKKCCHSFCPTSYHFHIM